jgi:TonB-linked SusC/RagA family outer membrane protein
MKIHTYKESNCAVSSSSVRGRAILRFFTLFLLSGLLATPLMNAVAQNRQLTGTIFDENREAVAGAQVLVVGTTNVAISDANGQFTISVPSSPDATIEVSYLGYTTRRMAVGSQSSLVINMVEDIQALDDIVVIGYGTVKRKDFAGSVASLKMEDSPVALQSNMNALEALKGTITGLDIGGTTGAGREPSMLVRGRNSINGTLNPLIVLDGVMYPGSISDINPNDIASYDILKDATSAAAYGSRSANGVIVINTKKGKIGKPVINFNLRNSFNRWHLQPELMNGEQWLDALSKSRNTPVDDILLPQERINRDAGKEINWYDVASRIGYTQDYQASVSGASDRVNYYLSGAWTDEQGVIVGDDFNRISILGKINTDITNWFQVGVDASYTKTDRSGVSAGLQGAAFLSPWSMMYRPNGEMEAVPDGTRGHGNPLWNVYDESKRVSDDFTDAFRMTAYAVVKLPWVEGLSYRMNYMTNLSNRFRGNFTHETNSIPAGPWDDDTRYSADVYKANLKTANGSQQFNKDLRWVVENILTYARTFGKHDLTLTAVATRDLTRSEDRQISGTDFAANGNTVLGYNGLRFATTQNISGLSNSQQTTLGYLARVMYAFDNRYFLQASYRRDGSSVFGEANKFGDFYTIGGAWNVTNESFWHKNNILTNFKFKLSWGLTGSQGLSRYQTLSTVDTGKSGNVYYTFGNSGQTSYGIRLARIGNNTLGWESTEAWNTGFESAWLGNRLFIDLDVYFKRTYDQVFNRSIPVMNGFGNMYSSMGEVKNTGMELTVRSVNINNRDFSWNTGVTFWLNRNKITHLYGDDVDGDGVEDDDIGNGLFIGQPISAIYGYKQIGIVQTSDTEYMNANGVQAGVPKYANIDGSSDGQITTTDRMILGAGDANFRLNMSNTLTYRDFQLYVMINGTFGGNNRLLRGNPTAFITGGQRDYFGANGLYVPYWSESNPTNTYPAPTFTGGDGRFLGLQSRGFVRLQDVTFSYTFNQPWVKRAGIGRLQLSASAKNLFTITNWVGGDPESGSQYRGEGVYANTSNQLAITSFTLGLNLGF